MMVTDRSGAFPNRRRLSVILLPDGRFFGLLEEARGNKSRCADVLVNAEGDERW